MKMLDDATGSVLQSVLTPPLATTTPRDFRGQVVAIGHPQTTENVNIQAVPGPWFVAHLHGNRETDFRDRLAAAGHTVYLPMREVTRRESKGAGQGTREVRGLFPLFPAYAFVAAPGHDAIYAAKATNLIWSLRPVVDQGRLVADLVGVQAALEQNPRLGAQRRIPKGTLCEVQPPHAMRGMIGVVSEDGGAFCLIVKCLGSSVPVEIDPGYLEPM